MLIIPEGRTRNPATVSSNPSLHTKPFGQQRSLLEILLIFKNDGHCLNFKNKTLLEIQMNTFCHLHRGIFLIKWQSYWLKNKYQCIILLKLTSVYQNKCQGKQIRIAK